MITIVRKLDIEAGHRLQKHESKCHNAHGHHYIFDIKCAINHHVRRAELDDVGRVVDFSVVKELVGGWLDENWDHGMIIEKGDPIETLLRTHHQKLFLLDSPPSAENLARHLYGVANQLLRPQGVGVLKVRCWETPRCYADFKGETA